MVYKVSIMPRIPRSFEDSIEHFSNILAQRALEQVCNEQGTTKDRIRELGINDYVVNELLDEAGVPRFQLVREAAKHLMEDAKITKANDSVYYFLDVEFREHENNPLIDAVRALVQKTLSDFR